MMVCDSLIAVDLEYDQERFTPESERRVKVDQIREAFERGDYHRDLHQVAQRILSRWIAEGRLPDLEKPA